MLEQEAAANDNAEVKVEKKKCEKKGKKKVKTTRVVAISSLPTVLSEGERLMAAVIRCETTRDTVEVKNAPEATGSGDGNRNAKPDEKEEGEIDGDEGEDNGEVKGKVKGNGEAPADKPAAADAPKE